MAKGPPDDPLTGERLPEHFIVVSYDIPDDKRRTRVSKVLEDFGERVQYSVFECRLRQKDYQRMQERLQPLLVVKEDDIRFFHLCESCRRKAKVWGPKRRRARRETIIV
jgi:CRISPR-associated protein Cas2